VLEPFITRYWNQGKAMLVNTGPNDASANEPVKDGTCPGASGATADSTATAAKCPFSTATAKKDS